MKNRFMMLYSKIKRVIKNPKAYCKYYSTRLNKIITLILSYLRIKLRRLSIRNRKVSLLSHDCTGAVLLHTVGLPFNSPTVNLYFPNLHEYIKYVRYLEEYSKLPVKVDKEAKEVFPCGVISHL